MDKLKKYLERHQPEMDVDVPAASGWEYIESNAPGVPVRARLVKRAIQYMAAASVVALVSVGIWLLVKNNKVPVQVGKAVKNSAQDTPRNIFQKEMAQNGSTTLVSKQASHIPASEKISKDAISASDIAVIDKSYTRLVNYQLRKLRSTPVYVETPGYFTVFAEQLKQMNKDERVIQNDIRQYGPTDELLEQLINIYQQKINLLKSLQAEINKMNNRVKEKQLPSEDLRAYYLDM
jgi:hypothetical protein